MFKVYKIMFLISLMAGSLMTISAYSWFLMWIGLEINLLSIIPLFKSHTNAYPAEATLKYFITQALASTMILFSIIISLNNLDYFPNSMNYWNMMILNSALLTKLGAAPFHSWFPEVMEGLSWMNNLMLLTWQKLAPMVLVMYNLNLTLFLSFIIIISSIIGSILGFNQISMRKIMAYSSINHIAWMLASMMSFTMIWIYYFMIYSLISLNIVIILYFLNIFKMNQLFFALNSNKLIKMFFCLNFLSLGGLPPFLGFLPKWLVINNLINSKFYLLSLTMIVFTLVTLYFYLRITFSTLTIASMENLLIINKMAQFSISFCNSFLLLGLFLSSSMLNLF